MTNDIKRIHKRRHIQVHAKRLPNYNTQHKKLLLCIKIVTGKMGKMTTNRKHTKTQKLQSDENTTDTQNDFTDKTAKRCKRP